MRKVDDASNSVIHRLVVSLGLSSATSSVVAPSRLCVNRKRGREPLRATKGLCLMSTSKSLREVRITITVEEVELPKVAEVPSVPEAPFSEEAADFLDEEDYSQAR